MEPGNRVILIDCPDEKGLVYRITKILFDEGLNITSNLEFVERSSGYFFMRTEIAGEFDEKVVEEKIRHELAGNANIRIATPGKKKIILFATKEYHCLGDLIERHHFGELNAEIVAVVSNHDKLRSFTEYFDIPFHHVPVNDRGRVQHEEAVVQVISQYDFDYLVLAKYMRILSPDFVARYPYQVINIHHSFLPAFIGANPYRQAYERGVKIIGATAHFVTDNLDEGPIIAQDVVSVNHTQSVKQMAQAGRDVEKIVLAKSLQLVFEDRCFVHGNKTVILN